MGHRMNGRRRGFTLVEVLIAMVAGSILLMGMGSVLFMIWRGFNETRDFSEATQRIDMIRQLNFDGRTGRSISFPTTWDLNGATTTSRGDYTGTGVTGDRVQFISLEFDTATNTTTPYMVTWQSLTATGAAPYRVQRWRQPVDALNQLLGTAVLTFDQTNVQSFEIIRTTNKAFSINMQAIEGAETATIQMVVTCRNIIS